MAELTKQALKVANNTEFPNNNNGAITPSNLRGFNLDMIDSTVNQAQYTTDSGSWNQQIDALESFSGSTAVSITNLNASSASQQTSINALNVFTASASGLTTGSLLITASASGNTITFTKGDTSTFNVTVATGSIPDISNLNQATASLQAFTASAAISITNLNASSASQQVSINALNTNSASVNTSITNLNASSASQQISINNLNAFSASASGLSTGSLLITASAVSNVITFTKGDASTFNVTVADTTNLGPLNTFTASAAISITNLNASSASQQVSINNLNTTSASLLVETQNLELFSASALVSISNLNASSASQQVSINALNSATSSYVTETESGSFLITASFDNGNRNLTFTKGNNTTFAVNIPDVSGSAGNFVTTSSFNSYTASTDSSISQLNASSASQQVSINNLNTTTASLLVETQNLETFSASALVSISNLNASSASQQTSINALNAATSSYVTSAITASSLVTASAVGNTITFTKGDASTFNVSVSSTPIDTSSFTTTASFNAYTQSNDQRVTSLEANSASVNTSITNVNSATASLFTSVNNLNSATSSLFGSASLGLTTASFNNGTRNLTFTKGDASTFSVNIPDVSGSAGDFVTTASFNAYTSSNNQRVSSLEAATSSYATSAITASSIITASVTNDDITFTKGDGSQFTIQVATGSFALSSSYAEYAETSSISNNLIVIARNGEASTLAAGTVVHITSAVGDNPVFTTASFDNEALSSNTFGLLRYSSPSGADVEVVVGGIVTGVNTDPVLGYAAGDVLYLSSSGQFTRVQPQAPNQIVVLGQVLRAQQNNGSIYVSINNGWELNELHNVQINGVQTGDLLQYESSSYGLWKNKSIAGAGITTTSSFNSYTSSTNSRLTNIESTTASLLVETQNLEAFSASALVSISNLNASSASQQVSINELNSATASLFTSASLSLTTASFSGNTLTFTKGNGTTFGVVIPDVSGSTINTGSFAITGSNTFRGNQTITGSVFISSSGGLGLSNTDGANVQYFGNSFGSNIGIYKVSDATEIGLALDGAVWTTNWGNGPIIYVNNTPGDTYEGVFGFQNKTNYTDGRITALKRLDVSGSLSTTGTFTSSLQEGYVWVGNSAGRTTTVATSSFGGGGSTNTGSLMVTGSIAGNILTFTKGDASTFDLTIPSATGSVFDTGSFATTGSNTFRGNQTITGSVIISSSAAVDLTVVGAMQVTGSATGVRTVLNSTTLEFKQPNRDLTTAVTDGQVIVYNPTVSELIIGVFDEPNFTNDVEFNIRVTSGSGIEFKDWDNGDGGYETWLSIAPNVSSNPDVVFKRSVDISGSLDIQNTLTASLQQGYVWVGNANGRTTTVATSSFAGAAPVGVATTGSNTFIGNQIITGSVDVSGSVKQTFNAPTLNNQTDLVAVKGVTVNGVPFNQQTIAVQNYDFGGDAYKNAFVIEAWDSLSYNFGGEALVNGETAQLLVVASGSAAGTTRSGIIGVLDNGNQKVKAVLSGQIIEIGGAGTPIQSITAESITIGRSNITSVISGSLNIQNTLTASLQQGYVWVGNASGRTTTVPTSSFGGGGSTFPFTGDAVITGSLSVKGNTTFTSNTGDKSSVILGNNAMLNSSGSDAVTNVAIGDSVLLVTQQKFNVGIGNSSLRDNTTGNQNTGIGFESLRKNTSGGNNFALGANAMHENTTGNQNIGIGVGALYSNINGALNTAVGNDSGFANVSGSRNVYIGPNSGNNHFGDNTIIIGGYSGGGQILNNNIILSDGQGNVELQYNGSTWTTENNFVVSGSLSAANDIKMGRGTNKPTNKVTVGASGLTVNNSLVTSNSYIFATSDTTVGNYSPIVSNITNGSFSLSNGGYGGDISVMYMIVNPF